MFKDLKETIEALDGINGFQYELGIDGGRGIFHFGKFKGMTVIWSFGGGWEHVSIDGKKRTLTWEEMCYFKDLF